MSTAKEIQAELRETGSTLAGLPQVTPFTLPAGYFSDLPALVLRRIKAGHAATAAEELHLLSPVLGNLKGKPTFSVPEGYFDKMKLPLPAAKVISMHPRNRILRYAAAAVTAGIIGIGAWFFSSRYKADDKTDLTENSADQHVVAVAGSLSDSEIVSYLDFNQPPSTPDSIATTADIGQEDMKVILADIPDQELQQFLDHDDRREQKLN